MHFKTVLSCFVRPKTRGRTSQMILSMKLIGVFLMAAAIHVSARSNAQITLQERQAPLQQVFKSLKAQTGYRFICTEEVFKKADKITVSLRDVSLKEALDICLNNKGLAYTIIGQTVAIRLATDKAPVTPKNEQQVAAFAAPVTVTVTGKVTDPMGYGLAAVSVVIPGTPLGTMTDRQGNYRLADVPENAELIFSYVGFVEQRIAVKDRTVINIQLQPVENELNEMVVIGYGKTTKKLNTGSAAVISADVIDKQPVANMMEALPGRVAGVLVTQNNGVPGANTQMEIRGKGSLNSGTIPLYVIDGVPYSNFNGAQPPNDNLNAWGISGANGGTSPFSSLNPADIESITILKDADATAIYGARGANGVVLITTKKGQSGASKTDLNVYSGFGKVGHYIPMLNTRQYLTLRKEAFANNGVDPNDATSRPYDLLDWDQDAYTDWQRYLLGGTARSTNANLSYSGGTAQTSYRLSGNYRHDGTVYPDGDFGNNRVTTRFSLGHHSKNKKFSFNFSSSYGHETSTLPKSDISSLATLPPNYPSTLTDSVGNLVWYPGFTNPLSYLRQSYHGVTNNIIGNLSLNYEVIKGWKLKLNAGYTHIDLDQKSASPASVQNPAYNPVSTAYFSNNLIENWIVEPTTDYTRKWGGSTVNVLLGGTFQQNISTTTSTKGTNYSSDLLLGSLQGAGLITSYYPNDAKYKFASLFSRVNYNFDNKYIVNATFRRDASSRFGPENRFGNFWAVGGAWLFSEESWAKEALPFLSFGKIRGSYGLTGNDQISNYIYLPLYSLNSNPYQDQVSYYRGTASNPYIQWETDKKLEFALELGFLEDRLMLTGSYYRNRSGNQLSYESLPTQSGFNSRTVNMPAVIQNKGLEFTISSQNIKTTSFQWHTDFNITLPSNKLISFPGLENSFYASSYEIGQPITLTKLYRFAGVDVQTGMPTFYAQDGSGIPNYSTDRFIAPIGTPYYGGLGNDLTFKNWALSFFIQYTHQMGYTNGLINGAPGASMANMNTSVLDRWQAPGDHGTLFPAASAVAGSAISNAYGYYFGSSDLFWGDASWLKLRTASLSYRFNKVVLQRLDLSQLRFYVEGQNLLTLARNKYQMDTETTVAGGPSGLGTGRYPAVPPLRTIVIGLNLSF